MAGDAVDFGNALIAELHPTRGTMRAHAAAAIMVDHDALADARLFLAHAGPDGDHDAAGLVPRDHRPGIAQSQSFGGLTFGRAIEFEVAPAHAGSLDLEDDLPRSGSGVGELAQLDPTIA